VKGNYFVIVLALLLAACQSQVDQAGQFAYYADRFGKTDAEDCPNYESSNLHISYGVALDRCTCVSEYMKRALPESDKAYMVSIFTQQQRSGYFVTDAERQRFRDIINSIGPQLRSVCKVQSLP
jgi:hypothetical protein